MLKIKKILITIIVVQLISIPAHGAEDLAAPKSEFNLQEITLPSEVKDMEKNSGAIYYSNSVKNKVLVPVHFWGEIKQSGLHFIPSDTTLIKGLSLAGGPTSGANLEDVVLIRSNGKNATLKEIEFDISEGGDAMAHQFKIESGDTIFLKKDTFYENRGYYTGLISIFVTVVSTFFIIQKVK